MNTVSASVGTAFRKVRRDANAPAADVFPETACANYRSILDTDDHHVCCSGMLFFGERH